MVRWTAAAASLGILSTGQWAHAAEPLPAPAERWVEDTLPTVMQRHVVRAGDGSLHLWMVTDLPFDRAVATVGKLQKVKKTEGLSVDRVTFLAPDQSHLLELRGDERPWRLRLSRHLQGSLVEVQDLSEATDAPKWLPPFRPQPVLLPHGAVSLR